MTDRVITAVMPHAARNEIFMSRAMYRSRERLQRVQRQPEGFGDGPGRLSATSQSGRMPLLRRCGILPHLQSGIQAGAQGAGPELRRAHVEKSLVRDGARYRRGVVREVLFLALCLVCVVPVLADDGPGWLRQRRRS